MQNLWFNLNLYSTVQYIQKHLKAFKLCRVLHFNNLHSPRNSRSLITCKTPVKITGVGSGSNRSLDMTDCMMNFSPSCLIVTQMTTRERERGKRKKKKVCYRDRHQGAYAESSRSTARKIDRGGWANLLALHDTCPLCNWSDKGENGGLWKKINRESIARHAKS